MQKSVFSLALLCSALVAPIGAVPGYSVTAHRNIYAGEKITPKSLLALVPQLDAQSAEVVLPWTEQNAAFLRELTHEHRPLYESGLEHNLNIARMAEMELQQLSETNYVFEIPGHEQHVVKISSPANRLHMRMSARGILYKAHQRKLTRDDLVTLAQQEAAVPTPTYSTIQQSCRSVNDCTSCTTGAV